MLICPVCRSQNMDTAKFCGNCGNPFQKQPEATSSLIQCAQGHIYSAVYEHCPYCPQGEKADASNFVTRVESGPVKDAEPPAMQPQYDFSTRIDHNDTMLDTLFENNEPAAVNPPPGPPASGTAPAMLAPTEVITSRPSFETIIESAAPSPPETGTPSVVNKIGQSAPTKFESVAPEQTYASNMAKGLAEAPTIETKQPDIFQPPAEKQPVEIERHTIVVADQGELGRMSKGKIVGWLITYTQNPDGDDFRVYSGYNRLGANPVCDIVIGDETVSGSHAIIVYRDGRCLIKDDLSRNGTFVNGREITEAHPLQNYDQIRLGNTFLTFISAERLP